MIDNTKLVMMNTLRILAISFKKINYWLMWVLIIVISLQIVAVIFPSNMEFPSNEIKRQYVASAILQVVDIGVWFIACYFGYTAIERSP